MLDIFSDRFNAGAFYFGLAWLQPELAPAVFVYLAEFMVVDCFLSIAFLAWPIRSPNYFYVVDRRSGCGTGPSRRRPSTARSSRCFCS